jgi:hypothetical protein
MPRGGIVLAVHAKGASRDHGSQRFGRASLIRTYRFVSPVLAVVVAALGTASVSAAGAPSGNGYWPMYMDGPARDGDNGSTLQASIYQYLAGGRDLWWRRCLHLSLQRCRS